MKRILSLILALAMLFAFAACSSPAKEEEKKTDDVTVETEEVEITTEEPEKEEVKEEETKEEAPEEVKPEETKPEEKPAETTKPTETKPTETTKPAKPAEPAKPTPAPEIKPAEPTPAPEVKPEEVKPEEKPAETPAATTLGSTLVSVFRANSTKSTEEIANAVLSHKAILFSPASMPVEEGFLTGFDNAEIKGFKSATMFAPGIGTIPFVGYVFELADGTDADAFVKTLRENANPRWNICTEAEETVIEKSGNKVFFLMCPKSLEE